MKTSGRTWTFINQSNPSESIIVHDALSAECLQGVLKHHEDWFLKEEGVKAAVPAPEPVVAPPPHRPLPQHMAVESVVPAAVAPPQMPASPPPLPAASIPKPVEDRRANEDRRSTPRFSTEFRVVLITGAHSYRNTTEDVSLGGMKLKRAVPHAFIGQKCTIFVSHPDLRENVQVSCKVLADPKDPRRIQFTDTDPAQLKRLQEWLSESAMRNKGVA
jgi:hypothetical protein